MCTCVCCVCLCERDSRFVYVFLIQGDWEKLKKKINEKLDQGKYVLWSKDIK